MEIMDLGGWNPDFDSSFLNCWDDNGDSNSRTGADSNKPKQEGRNRSLSSSRSSPRDDPSMWDGALNQWSQLQNFDYEGATSEKSKGSEDEGVSSTGGGSSQPMTGNGNGIVSSRETEAQRVTPQGDNSTRGGPPSVSTSTGTQSVSAAQVSMSANTSVASLPGTRGEGSTVSEATSNPPNGSGLHPLAIQSSATCPPHGHGAYSQSAAPKPANPPMHQQIPSTGTAAPQAAYPGAVPQHLAHNLYGLAAGLDSSSMASLAASLQGHSTNTNHHVLPAETTQHLSNLAANFMLAQGSATMPTQQVHGHVPQQMQTAAVPTSASLPHPQQAQAQQMRTPASTQPPAPAPVAARTTTARNSSSSSSKHRSSTTRKQSSKQRKAAAAAQQHSQATGGAPDAVPPFYLFDAPIELRANFMQNQRRLGIPVQEDCNSYHYGETVKGFHPQNLLDAKHPPAAATAPPAPVQLVDARHGNPRQPMAGRVKNEREQKRAQKITELIEQLRQNMESGGWKVEMRSKFHTLSSCAEYVKHMIKSIKEKEEKMKELTEELEVKQQKIAEDKSVQESRSDPESVTSSLTSSTGGSHSHKADGDGRKRKAIAAANGDDSTASTSNKKHCDSNSRNVSSYGTCEDSSGDDRGSGSGGQFNDVSDITDSNRGSSSNSNSSGSGGSDDGPTVTRDASEDDHQPAGSISSDAAVRSEKSSHKMRGNRQHHMQHKDVVFTDKKSPEHAKRKSEEITSLHSTFELDYEEVFGKSNIPQIIASTSGKVVTWNEVFMKATGLRKSEMERMTIFSLVQPDKLSNFFQIVAAALKPEEEQQPTAATDEGEAQAQPETNNADGGAMDVVDQPGAGGEVDSNIKVEEGSTKGGGSTVSSSGESEAPTLKRTQDYTAITLPCIDFPGMKKRRECSEQNANLKPLHVTVTLMDDEDPNKRCFHCVFTNCKGTDGSLGLITPELLEALFKEPEVKKSKSHRHHHHKSKRPRTQEQPRKEEERLDGNKIDKIIPIPRKANANTTNKTNSTNVNKTETNWQETASESTIQQEESKEGGDSSAQDSTEEEASAPTDNSK